MIIDKLSNAKLYKGLHPRLKKGLQFLQKNDINSIAPGRYEIEGDKLYLLVQEYETKSVEQARFESHYQYTDIQYMVQGEEKMSYSNVENLKLAEEDKPHDIMFYEGSGEFLTVQEGYFAIFMPQDAHMPAIYVREPKFVKKVLVKVLCD